MITKRHEELFNKFLLKISGEMKVETNELKKYIVSIKGQDLGLIGCYQPIIVEVEFSTGEVFMVGEDPNVADGFSYGIKNY